MTLPDPIPPASSPSTSPDVTPQAAADLRWAIGDFAARETFYRLYRNYYAGRHRLAFATDRFRNTFGALFHALSLNLMPAVVSAVADRLQVERWMCEDGPATRGTAAEKLWAANTMDVRSGEVHQEALTLGDAYVIVWPDPQTGEPTIYPQDGDTCTVSYDAERPGHVLFAAKRWTLPSKRVRLNLYYPDRLEKYISRGPAHGALPTSERSFIPFDAAAGNVDDPAWPLPHPYGVVPVFHFANDAAIGKTGKSELHDAIPAQDMTNKAVADELVASEFAAYRQRYAIGIEVEIEDDPASPNYGKPKALPWTPGIDRLWTTENEAARFGEFSAADLNQLLAAADKGAEWISRITGIPPHYFATATGNVPSGESLRRAEARLLKKIIDRQMAWGAIWGQVMRLALQVGGTTVPEGARLVPQWADPTPRSELEDAQTENTTWATAVIKDQLGVPKSRILVEGGYTEVEVAEFEAEKQHEAQASLEAAQRAFDSGKGFGRAGQRLAETNAGDAEQQGATA